MTAPYSVAKSDRLLKGLGLILSYARLSTEDQRLDAQLAAIEAAGAGWVLADVVASTLVV